MSITYSFIIQNLTNTHMRIYTYTFCQLSLVVVNCRPPVTARCPINKRQVASTRGEGAPCLFNQSTGLLYSVQSPCECFVQAPGPFRSPRKPAAQRERHRFSIRFDFLRRGGLGLTRWRASRVLRGQGASELMCSLSQYQSMAKSFFNEVTRNTIFVTSIKVELYQSIICPQERQ